MNRNNFKLFNLLQLLHISSINSQLFKQVRGFLHHARTVNQGGEGDASFQPKVVIYLKQTKTVFKIDQNCLKMSHSALILT